MKARGAAMAGGGAGRGWDEDSWRVKLRRAALARDAGMRCQPEGDSKDPTVDDMLYQVAVGSCTMCGGCLPWQAVVPAPLAAAGAAAKGLGRAGWDPPSLVRGADTCDCDAHITEVRSARCDTRLAACVARRPAVQVRPIACMMGAPNLRSEAMLHSIRHLQRFSGKGSAVVPLAVQPRSEASCPPT